MFTVRPYTQADYADFVRINTATQSTAFWGEADWQPIHPPCDETPEAKRYIAVHTASSQVVGYGAVLLAEQANLDVMVHPEWQRRGVGTLLWEQLQQDLLRSGSGSIGPWVRADNLNACRWLTALGFSLISQDGPVQLSIDRADVPVFASAPERLAEQDIVVTTLPAEEETRVDFLERFCELFQNVEKDVPGRTPASQTSSEQCLQELALPGMLLDAVFIAKHGKQYVGLSMLRQKITADDVRFAGPNSLSQHLTGVHVAYRRRGIALALKRRTIQYAQQHSYQRILTQSDNTAMRSLNRKLGFRPGPWLIYHKAL